MTRQMRWKFWEAYSCVQTTRWLMQVMKTRTTLRKMNIVLPLPFFELDLKEKLLQANGK